MSELNILRCRCALTPGGARVIEPEIVCPVPHDRWLLRTAAAGVAALAEAYPCQCRRRGDCSIQWCACAGRIDLENVPAECCAHRFTPRQVAIAIHGGDYRTCWCAGDIDRHKREVSPAVAALIPDLPEDDDDEEE